MQEVMGLRGGYVGAMRKLGPPSRGWQKAVWDSAGIQGGEVHSIRKNSSAQCCPVELPAPSPVLGTCHLVWQKALCRCD